MNSSNSITPFFFSSNRSKTCKTYMNQYKKTKTFIWTSPRNHEKLFHEHTHPIKKEVLTIWSLEQRQSKLFLQTRNSLRRKLYALKAMNQHIKQSSGDSSTRHLREFLQKERKKQTLWIKPSSIIEQLNFLNSSYKASTSLTETAKEQTFKT